MIATRTGGNMQHPSIFGYLATQLEQRPDSNAYVYRGGKTTFRELHSEASKLAGALKARGLVPGDRVAMVMQDSIELVLAILAVMGVGAIAVPINPALSEADICHVINDSGAKALFVSEVYLDIAVKLESEMQNVEAIVTSGSGRPGIVAFADLLNAGEPVALLNADGPAFIVYTSGSTGRPKGALHYHSDVCCIVETIGRQVYEIQPSDRMFSASRTPFAYGFGNTIGFTIGFGAPMILLSERPTPESIAKVFAEFDPTIFFAVPAVFRNILEFRRQGGSFATKSLKFSAAGGENLRRKPSTSGRSSAIRRSLKRSDRLNCFTATLQIRSRGSSWGALGWPCRDTISSSSTIKDGKGSTASCSSRAAVRSAATGTTTRRRPKQSSTDTFGRVTFTGGTTRACSADMLTSMRSRW